MTKINHEEYKALKELDDEFKWIARDKKGELYVYNEKPIKLEIMWSYVGLHTVWVRKHEYLFHFIQWEDEEPYNIAELVEEYEYSAEHVSHVINGSMKALGKALGESEETEVKKDIEWLKNEIYKRDKGYMYKDDILHLINSLDEPEVLSQEWIDGKTFVVTDSDGDDYAVVAHSSLQNLLVPKQEKMKVSPQEDRFITECKLKGYSLHAFIHCAEVSDENCERLTRAWLDGFTVEKPLYYALVKGHELIKDEGDWTYKYWNFDTSNGDLFPSSQFTESGKFLIEMSKEDWNKLGINNSNADFVKADE